MSNSPRVSVCVPCLNTRPYLPERFETIFAQTFTDWELVVLDSYSDDGSWEYITELAANEPRMRISQGPRGLYTSWNSCVKSARGEFIYIATSDDTMAPDCLEKMVAALDANPDCGLCQCALEIIDENSAPYPAAQQWDHYTLGSYDQNLVLRRNKRIAPHDGMVHPALLTIYTSVTQLLIRRSVFDRVGFYDGQWGSTSDFEWDMRAGLVESCIYIPEKLATWRRHAQQATGDVNTLKNRLKMISMTRAALKKAKQCNGPSLESIRVDDLLYFLERDAITLECLRAGSRKQLLGILLTALFRWPRATIDHIRESARESMWGHWSYPNRYRRLRETLHKYGVPPPLLE